LGLKHVFSENIAILIDQAPAWWRKIWWSSVDGRKDPKFQIRSLPAWDAAQNKAQNGKYAPSIQYVTQDV
jgi:hypothetical protein